MKKGNDFDEQLSILKKIGFFLLMVVVFYVGFGFGMASESAGIKDTSGNFLSSQQNVDMKQFWDMWNSIKTDHIDAPIDDEVLMQGALRGIAEAIGDPYSQYFDPEMAEAFQQDLEGSFYGIGAEIGLRDDLITVIAPLAGSPAIEAGLRAGDKILAVDGEETYDWSVTEAVRRIRGEKGVPVILTVYTTGDEAEREVEIIRDEITIESVTLELLDGNIAKVNINQFNEDTFKLFNQVSQDIIVSDVKGIILDLRNNPGGLLDQAVAIADFWIDDKLVVTEKFQDGEIPMFSRPGASLNGIPTVVLVNGGSASGAEILAGALQDYDLAHVIGEQTFGKGSVQEYRPYNNGSALKLTIAKWLTPSGNSINEVGITPDQFVELTIEDFNVGAEPQIEAAIDYLEAAQ